MDGEKKQRLFIKASKVCPVCGKVFFVHDTAQWRFKKGSVYYDSWTCFQKGVKK